MGHQSDIFKRDFLNWGKAEPGSAFFNGPTFDIEKELVQQNRRVIAGIDEAGRGALAGPLSVGLVVYSADFIINEAGLLAGTIQDSKKLTPAKRNSIAESVFSHASVVQVAMVSHRTIDSMNINRATEYAVLQILKRLPLKPDVLIMDGNYSFSFEVDYVPIIKGDSKSISIASASILAKVRRDAVMDKLHEKYPQYDFIHNKGYGTRKHREAIFNVGHSPVHRLTYEPVRGLVSGQRGLFSP